MILKYVFGPVKLIKGRSYVTFSAYRLHEE